jgi:methylamine---glutamate N-methyltransferase subunit B
MAGLVGKKDHRSHEMGMHTEGLLGRTQQRFFDLTKERSSYGYPDALDVDFNKRAEFDCANLGTSQINAELRELVNRGVGTVVLRNPGSKHSLAVGILHRLNLHIEGSCGYFACGLIDGPNVTINGRVGWACGENMMAGTIVVEKNAGSQFGAALRGGDLVCKGSVGGRTGIDQKGGTIIVGGDTGSFSGFMMQRGRIVILGNAGKNLGDSMYDGTIYLGGEARSLGVDAVPGEITDGDREWLSRKLKMYDMLPKSGIGHIKKIVAGKQLWNYDNLEPSEKKLVL